MEIRRIAGYSLRIGFNTITAGEKLPAIDHYYTVCEHDSALNLALFELRNYLLGLLLVGHVEVTELITVLLVSNHAEEITQLLLLQVLLSQVLQVALGHRDVRFDDNLSLSFLGDGHGFAEVTDLVLNLYPVAEKLLLQGIDYII